MFIHNHLKVNKNHHLEICGCDAVELAKEYGTPLYVMDDDRLRDNMRIYKNAIDKYYDGKGSIHYASKALCNMYLCKTAQQEGLGLDVVSGGELYTAVKAGFDASEICFHGNNKTYDELCMAVENKVGRIIVDNSYELDTLNGICAEKGVKQSVIFRIKPGVDAHTHEFISTGQIDSKFGFAIETGEAYDIFKKAMSLENIDVKGIHCHIGSQIFDLEPFTKAAEVMIKLMADAKNDLGLVLTELDLGGGFGIKYTENDDPISYDAHIKSVSEVVKKLCNEYGVDLPFIYMEPGRSIVGDAGITLYTVGSVKDIPNVRKYVSIDGGMADNPRYIMYDALYDGVVANKADSDDLDTYTLCGKCCESGDIIIKEAHMQKCEAGDIVAVMSTGAYNFSMASNYNRIPRPAMITVSNGKSKLIVKRESYEDIIKNDVM